MFQYNRLTRVAAAAVFAFAFSATRPALADEAAEQFIASVLMEAEPSLKAGDQSVMFEGIAELVDKYVDIKRVGLFTLGQYARQLTDSQKQEYFPLFRQYAKQVYQNSLSNYSGQTLKVTGSVDRSERDIIVNSKVADPAPGDELANLVIHWRVYRDRDGSMSVVDAGADNVWLAIEQRGQFTSVIANNGGGTRGIDALIAELREQVGG